MTEEEQALDGAIRHLMVALLAAADVQSWADGRAGWQLGGDEGGIYIPVLADLGPALMITYCRSDAERSLVRSVLGKLRRTQLAERPALPLEAVYHWLEFQMQTKLRQAIGFDRPLRLITAPSIVLGELREQEETEQRQKRRRQEVAAEEEQPPPQQQEEDEEAEEEGLLFEEETALMRGTTLVRVGTRNILVKPSPSRSL
jgi:hypothetical protein